MIVDFGNYCPSLEKKKSLLSRRTPIRKNESKFKQIQLPHSKVIAVIQRIISENGRWFIDQKGNGERRSGRGASRRSSTHFPQSHNDDDWADCLSPRIDRVIEVSGDEGLKTLTNFNPVTSTCYTLTWSQSCHCWQQEELERRKRNQRLFLYFLVILKHRKRRPADLSLFCFVEVY